MNFEEPIELHEIIRVSDELRQELVDKHIEPFYVETVKSALNSNLFWKRTAIFAETTSKILIALAGVLSFGTGYFHEHKDTLSFLSGSISCVSLGTIQLSVFALKEHRSQTRDLNAILKRLNIDPIPVIHRTHTESNRSAPEPIRRSSRSLPVIPERRGSLSELYC